MAAIPGNCESSDWNESVFFGGPYLVLPLGDTRKSFLRVATSGEPKALKYKSLKPKSKKESSHESKKREAKILKP